MNWEIYRKQIYIHLRISATVLATFWRVRAVTSQMPSACSSHPVQAIRLEVDSYVHVQASQLAVYYLLIRDPGCVSLSPPSGPKNRPKKLTFWNPYFASRTPQSESQWELGLQCRAKMTSWRDPKTMKKLASVKTWFLQPLIHKSYNLGVQSGHESDHKLSEKVTSQQRP